MELGEPDQPSGPVVERQVRGSIGDWVKPKSRGGNRIHTMDFS